MNEERSFQAERLESIGRLAGGVAHDFNNLLTIITGYTDMLLEDAEASESSRSILSEIRGAADRAGDLTKQLLAFSRRQSIRPETVDINTRVRSVERLLRRLIGEHITLAIELNENAGSAKLDPTQFEQVLMNLAVNARDAMPDGGTLRVSTRKHFGQAAVIDGVPVPAGEYVQIVVEDSGVGMNNQVLRHIFEPFYSTKKSKGTGLGLATVYGIVKQHSGFIFVTSEPGHGSRFEILFPSIVSVEAPVTVTSPRYADAGGTETVLLVEDEPVVRRLAAQVLTSAGFKVVEAGDGEEALSVLESREAKLNLVVSDVIMPRLGGPEFAAIARKKWPTLRFVFMSGYVDESFGKSRALPAGTVFLPKPFTRDRLVGTIRQVLDGAPVAA